MVERKKNYNGLDLGKFLMSVLVIAIHTRPLSGLENQIILNAYQNIVNIAVPFFFLSSSWLFFRKRTDVYSDICLSDLKERVFHFMRIYLIWEILYLPCILWGYCRNGYGLLFNLTDYIRKFLFVGSNYYSSQLWFVLSMVYLYASFFFFLKKKFNMKIIFAISVLFYIVGIMLNYCIGIRLYEETGWVGRLVGYFMSLCNKSTVLIYVLYLALGMIMAEYHVLWSKKVSIVIFMLVLLCDILFPDGFLMSSLLKPIQVTAVFQLFMQCETLRKPDVLNFRIGVGGRIDDQSIYIKLRKSSMVLFYTHFYFIFLYEIIFHVSDPSGLEVFAMCLIGCVIVSIIVVGLSKYSKFRWLRRMFGW